MYKHLTKHKRDFTKFNKNDFTLNILQVDMETHLKITNNNAKYSMTQFLNIDAPYKQIQSIKNTVLIESIKTFFVDPTVTNLYSITTKSQ